MNEKKGISFAEEMLVLKKLAWLSQQMARLPLKFLEFVSDVFAVVNFARYAQSTDQPVFDSY